MDIQDPVSNYLRSRGWDDETVSAGLDGLVGLWAAAVEQVARTEYKLTLDDYLNDLDVRDALAGALVVATREQRGAVEERVRVADVMFLAASYAVEQCLWGGEIAAENSWDAESHWWYYRVPRKRGAELERDLAGAKVLVQADSRDADSE